MPNEFLEPRVIGALITTAACLILAAFVYAKNTGQSSSKYFCFFNLCLAIWNFGEIFVVFTTTNPPLALTLDRISYFGATALIPCYLKMVTSLGESGFSDRAIARVYRIFFGSFVVLSVLIFTPLIIKSVNPPPNEEVPGPLFFLFAIYFITGLSLGLVQLISIFRRSSPNGKNRLKYFIFALSIGVIAAGNYFNSLISPNSLPLYHYLEILYSISTAYAIVKHRLMDIAVIIRRTLIYSIVMGTLTISYLVLMTLLTRVFAVLTGYETVLSSTMAAALITIGFQPLRKRVQGFVDTRFFRHYVDREEKLYELSREVITHTTSEAMAQSLIRVLSDTLHPKSVALYLRSRDGDGFVLVSDRDKKDLPGRMPEKNALADYLKDHPQPFVQQYFADEIGKPLDTRRPQRTEDAA